jgi:hypothetical protein
LQFKSKSIDDERVDDGMSSLGIAVIVFVGVVGVISLAALYVFIQIFTDSPFFEGVESKTVEAVVEPGQTILAKVEVKVDMNEVVEVFDELSIELALAEPSPRAAVFGSFGVESIGVTQPALITDKVDVETLDVPYPCGPEVSRCRIPVEIQLGNVGTTPERWVLTASISRSTRDEEEADQFEVSSLSAQLTEIETNDNEWVSPGPVAFETANELVAYAVTIHTSVTDPSLIEVVVTEPRHHLVTRSIEVVVGPEDPSWSQLYFEPDPAPLANKLSAPRADANCTWWPCSDQRKATGGFQSSVQPRMHLEISSTSTRHASSSNGPR